MKGEAGKSAPGSIDFLERSVELQPVSVGVEHVELPSAPGGVSWCLPRALTHSIEHSAVAKFGIQSVDLLDPNAVSRSIDGVSPLRLRLPLQVQFYAVTQDAGILGIYGAVLERHRESQPGVETNRGANVPGHEHWVDRLELCPQGSSDVSSR